MIFISGWSRKRPASKVTCDESGGNESVAPKSRGRLQELFYSFNSSRMKSSNVRILKANLSESLPVYCRFIRHLTALNLITQVRL